MMVSFIVFKFFRQNKIYSKANIFTGRAKVSWVRIPRRRCLRGCCIRNGWSDKTEGCNQKNVSFRASNILPKNFEGSQNLNKVKTRKYHWATWYCLWRSTRQIEGKLETNIHRFFIYIDGIAIILEYMLSSTKTPTN